MRVRTPAFLFSNRVQQRRCARRSEGIATENDGYTCTHVGEKIKYLHKEKKIFKRKEMGELFCKYQSSSALDAIFQIWITAL